MKLRTIIVGIVALCVAVFMPVRSAQAQSDSALLDALVKKGVLSDQEAEDIRADEEKDFSSTAASKFVLSPAIKTIQFFGDLRLRYELRDGVQGSGSALTSTPTTTKGDTETLNRWRYRFRFGVKGDLYDNFFYGVRAATNPNNDRSGNVTFGHSDGAGPFGKDQSLMGLDEVYLGWHTTSDITLTGGQFPNPLYTTNLVWDDNLNPAGAAEQYDHTFGNTEVFATAGQFLYQAAAGNGIVNGIGGGTSFSDTFMFAEQAGFKFKFDDNTFFKGAAGFYSYSGTKGNGSTTVGGLYSDAPLNLSNAAINTATGAITTGTAGAGQENNNPSFYNGPFVGAANAPVTNVSGIDDLAVLEIPMEFDFKAWSVPMRFFSDFAYNTEADERANQARAAINAIAGTTSIGNVGVTGAGTVAGNNALIHTSTFQGVLRSGKGFEDQSAYQVGWEGGELKKKGDWDGKIFWQSTGYYAVDPNMVDADIFNAATNMQGIVLSVAHNWTDGLSSTIRYAYATPVNGLLATPNVNQDLQIGDIRQYNLLQLDLMMKF